MKRWSAWALALAATGFWVFEMASGARSAQQDNRAHLTIASPKDNASVRETVRVLVPKAAVPDEGFISVYVDGRFRAAVAPPPAPTVTDPKATPAAPAPFITYEWDTKRAEGDSLMTPPQLAALTADGPHVLEVRSYDQHGAQVDSARVGVMVKNKIDVAPNTLVELRYGPPDPDRRGQALWYDEHNVDFKAEAGFRGASTVAGSGYNSLNHKENSTYLLSIEDSGPFEMFMRERREPIIRLTRDNVPELVKLDSSSIYYTMDRKGSVEPSNAMKRSSREAFIDILELPGKKMPLNSPAFKTNVKVSLGTYIPTLIKINDAQATLDGMEWEAGEKTVKIKVTYNSGKYPVTVLDAGIKDADFTLQSGTSTIYFAPALRRVVRADHDILGTMKVPVTQLSPTNPNAGGGFSEGAPGAPGGPMMGPGMMGPGGSGGPMSAGMAGMGGMMGAPGMEGGPAGGRGKMNGMMGGMSGGPGAGMMGPGAGGPGGGRGRGAQGGRGRGAAGGGGGMSGGMSGGGGAGMMGPGAGAAAGGRGRGMGPGMSGGMSGGMGGAAGPYGGAPFGPGGASPYAPGLGGAPGGFAPGGAGASTPAPTISDFQVTLKVSTVAKKS